MATLVQVTREMRLIAKIAGGIAAFVFIVFIGIQVTQFIQKTFFPTPIPPPEEKFRKLPRLSFPPSEGNTALTYQINTVSGTLPTFPDRIKVYATVKPAPNILALQTARGKVSQLGFKSSEAKLSDTLYQWTNPDTGATIQFNILSNNFDINSSYLSNPNLSTSLPPKSSILEAVSRTISALSIDTTDIDQSKTAVSYFKVTNGALIKSEKEFDAQVARVDFFQNDIDQSKIFYSDPRGSTLYFVTGVIGQLQVLEAHFNHTIVDKNSSSSYPLKTVMQAYQDLQSGNAYIVNRSAAQTIDITDVNLGYYLGTSEVYLQPIFVFYGKDFIAYVSAIPNTSLE